MAKHKRVAVGFYKDDEGKTRPVTKSVAELKRKKLIEKPRKFKGVSPEPTPRRPQTYEEFMDYQKRYRRKFLRWTSKYLGRVTCPKCEKRGSLYVKLKTNIRTGSHVVSGFQVMHERPYGEKPRWDVCQLTKSQAREFGAIIPDFDEVKVRGGAPKGYKYTRELLETFSKKELMHVAEKRKKTDPVGYREVLGVIDEKYGKRAELATCKRCGHTWTPKVRGRQPKYCPKCKSVNWQRERHPQLTCQNCGYTWTPNVESPKKCGKCGSTRIRRAK